MLSYRSFLQRRRSCWLTSVFNGKKTQRKATNTGPPFSTSKATVTPVTAGRAPPRDMVTSRLARWRVSKVKEDDEVVPCWRVTRQYCSFTPWTLTQVNPFRKTSCWSSPHLPIAWVTWPWLRRHERPAHHSRTTGQSVARTVCCQDRLLLWVVPVVLLFRPVRTGS